MTAEDAKMLEAEELEVRRLISGYVHVRGRGPCNWAQGESLATIEPYAEAGERFRCALRALARKGADSE